MNNYFIKLKNYILEKVTTVGPYALGALSLYVVIKIFISGFNAWMNDTPYYDLSPVIVTESQVKKDINESQVKKDINESQTDINDKPVLKEKELNSMSNEAYAKIEQARNEKVLPTVVNRTSTDSIKVAKDTIENTKPDIVISEPTANHIGTNVYTFDIKRAQHGLGLYMGYKDTSSGERKENISYGIHYRNRRSVYQVGRDFKGNVEGRFVYEISQW